MNGDNIGNIGGVGRGMNDDGGPAAAAFVPGFTAFGCKKLNWGNGGIPWAPRILANMSADECLKVDKG